MTLTRQAKTFIGVMVLAATAIVIQAAAHGQTWHLYPALTLLVVALATSRMRVALPGITGNMSVNLPFLLLSLITLSPAEAILITCASTLAQTLPKQGAKFKLVHLLFNVSMMAVACGAAGLVFHTPQLARLDWFPLPLLIAASTAVFFLGQTVPVSIIVALTDGGSPWRTWGSIARLSFPYFVLSAGVASMVSSVGHEIGSPAALLTLLVMFGIYRSYQLYFVATLESVAQPLALAASAGTGR